MIEKARSLYQDGRYEEAYKIFLELHQQEPDDEDLKHEYLQCKRMYAFEKLVQEADELQNYKNYSEALEKYDQALRIDDDFLVQARRDQCAAKLSGEEEEEIDILGSFGEEEEKPNPPIEDLFKDFFGSSAQSGQRATPPPKESIKADIVVSLDGRGQYISVPEAVKNARSGNTILVKEGTYTGRVYLDKNLSIIGEGDVIFKEFEKSAIYAEGGKSSLKNIHIQGLAGSEAKVFAVSVAKGNLKMINCKVNSNALSAVGVYNKGSKVEMINCEIYDARQSGVYFYHQGGGTLNNCHIHRCGNDGVNVTDSGSVTVTACHIHNNEGDGVCYQTNAMGLIADCNIHDNAYNNIRIQTGAFPGVKYCKLYNSGKTAIGIGENSNPHIMGCEIHSAKISNILIHDNASPTLEDCKIYNSEQAGIYVYDNGKGKVLNCQLYQNKHEGLSIEKKSGPFFSIEGCQVFENERSGVRLKDESGMRMSKCKIFKNKGTGVRIDASEANITDSEIYDQVEADGMFVINGASVTLERVAVNGNGKSNIVSEKNSRLNLDGVQAHNSAGFGILTFDTHINIKNASVQGNAYSGMLFKQNSVAQLRNCDVDKNKQNGLFVIDSSHAEVDDSSFSENGGSGIKLFSKSRANVRNTHIDQNGESGFYTKENGYAEYSGCWLNDNKKGQVIQE